MVGYVDPAEISLHPSTIYICSYIIGLIT